jgi:hypothetical protein
MGPRAGFGRIFDDHIVCSALDDDPNIIHAELGREIAGDGVTVRISVCIVDGPGAELLTRPEIRDAHPGGGL